MLSHMPTVLDQLSCQLTRFIHAWTEVSIWKSRHHPWERTASEVSTSMIPHRPWPPSMIYCKALGKGTRHNCWQVCVKLESTITILRKNAFQIKEKLAGNECISNWITRPDGCMFDTSLVAAWSDCVDDRAQMEWLWRKNESSAVYTVWFTSQRALSKWRGLYQQNPWQTKVERTQCALWE